MTTAMLPPVTYQGGKGRLAAAIVDAMRVPADATFVDICCGSGAVTLALLDSGHDPGRIVMIDQGPWTWALTSASHPELCPAPHHPELLCRAS